MRCKSKIMVLVKCRREVRRALTASVIITFLLGCLFAARRLMEVDASREEELGRNVLQKGMKLPINKDADLSDSLGDNKGKFFPDLPQGKLVANSKRGIIVGDNSPNKQSDDFIHGDRKNNASTDDKRRNLNLHMEIQKSKADLKDISWPEPSYNLHVFYYLWYGNPDFDKKYYHWNHEILPHWNKIEAKKWASGRLQPPGDIGSDFYPALGCYSSQDPAVIEDHMRQLRLAGVGVLSVSWYPKGWSDDQGTPVDWLIPAYLDAAHKFGLKITFHSEPYKDRNEVTFLNDIRYVIDQYSKHPAFYRHNVKGRDLPMFYIYDSYLTNASKWARVFGESGDLSVRNTGYDGIFLGLYVETRHRKDILEGKFDGFYTYFASNGFTYASRWQNWKNLAEFARQRALLFVPSVGPGYVDTRVRPWNNVNTRKRDDGKYYDRAFQAALGVKPSIISVTSFNEWHEGTQIERAVPKKHISFTYQDYGREGPDKYLLLTQKWAEAFKVGR